MWPSQEVRESLVGSVLRFPFSLSALPKSGEEGLFLFPRRCPPPPSLQSEDGGDSAERSRVEEKEEKIKQESHPRLCAEEIL